MNLPLIRTAILSTMSDPDPAWVKRFLAGEFDETNPFIRAGIDAAEAALGEWKCGSCKNGVYRQPWSATATNFEVICKVCGGSGLHPKASAALSRTTNEGDGNA